MQSYLISILLTLPIILLSLSLHETAHGFAAWRLGDPTARNLGRLTLNPLKHLNPIGFLCMVLAGFGWANPVPVNSRNFRKPRRDMALTSLAGPVSNLLLAFVFLLLLRFVGFGVLWNLSYPSQTAANMAYFFILFLYYGVSMNVTLAVFNLLPIPPLDGSRILFLLLPPRLYYKIAPYERYIVIGVMLLLLLGPLSWLINWVCSWILKGMFALVGMSGFLI
ncbi:MAG: site-2 protease family protein [Clostridia bacterium]|nr:site-2 protease family protein [Clostridia bacterium]